MIRLWQIVLSLKKGIKISTRKIAR